MGGVLIQLIAKGVEDIHIIHNPQVTQFKIVYRRHTNFSLEDKIINFNKIPNFGDKASCEIQKYGDCVNRIFVVVNLPTVNPLISTTSGTTTSTGVSLYQGNSFAWVRNIGYAIIKTIEIEIGGKIIDRHYGESLFLFNELFGPKSEQYNKMIGNVPELYSFTNGKDPYTLYIPLQFWFCRASGLSLPITSLLLSDIKINVEFQDLSNCYITAPTSYINCNADMTAFKKYELLTQNYDGTPIYGYFHSYDIVNKNLYYIQLSNRKFTGVPYATPTSSLTSTVINAILSTALSYTYRISGEISKFYVIPYLNAFTITNYFPTINLSLGNTYLLTGYVYLDDDERQIFFKKSHEYLIEQLYFTPNIVVDSINNKLKISLEQPTKLMFWVTQLNDVATSLDYFNYTNSFSREVIPYSSPDNSNDLILGKTNGRSLVVTQALLLNGKETFAARDYSFFNYTIPYQCLEYGADEGINVYNFGLFPQKIQPSGTCNMSMIATIDVQITYQTIINVNTIANFRCYGLVYNMLKINNGIGAVVFTI